MGEHYRSLDEKPYESRYLYAETILDHPPERAWPHVVHIGRWMTDHRLVTLAGQPGEVGHFERVFSRDVDVNAPLPHYHLYGIAEIIPFKYLSLEVFSEKGGSYGQTRAGMAFDNLFLTDLGGKTKLTFLQIEVHLGERQENDESWQMRMKQEVEVGQERLQRYFENLKRLIE